MNVLSVFDGISCGQLALQRAEIKVDNYYASEINKHSIKVTKTNFPRTHIMGDVLDIFFYEKHFEIKNGDSWLECDHGGINILLGGSPCQDISNLNQKKEGLKGKKSSLFYKFLEAKEAYKNAWYLLENVSGTDTKIITKELKKRPIRLDSNWLVPQNRNRYYWTNIPVNSLPIRKKIILQDILENEVDQKYYQTEGWNVWWEKNKKFQLDKGYSTLNATRAGCLTARMYASWNGNFIQDERGIRRLSTIECERLQTIPDGYTASITDKWAYHCLGDCWTVDIVAHILKHIPK